uniref:Uncharacterized protein n=1 Tax=Anguilla anguilla TaxID=7936 RepID=A0A0E9Q8G4_ANGAN
MVKSMGTESLMCKLDPLMLTRLFEPIITNGPIISPLCS